MVGVGKHDLRTYLTELRRGDALHGGAGPDRHEDRRLDRSVGGVEAAMPGGAAGVSGDDVERMR